MVRVTAAVLESGGRILIAKRPVGDPLAGYWEFPGGKIEEGEDPRVCLARELREELGVTAEIGDFLVHHVHRYPHVTIELLSYRATVQLGDIEVRDHEEVRWVLPEEFAEYSFAPADLATVRWLQEHAGGARHCPATAGPHP
ncbi:MAG: (deoxy)nucleoside triphosphate pyrophosphohydrolase [Deltaproteobacteria bacterium]|nr:(deoxy)nucleoside triphosphate pyrophosphohydrolase [Deltaproteobacteria bacterium]